MSRIFRPSGDPLGTPDYFGLFFIPQVNVEFVPVLPAPFGHHDVGALQALSQVISMDHAKATALVRAARLYQDALWLVESTPEIAWLLLVSAIEVAANDWQRGRGDSVERLRLSKPELYNLLNALPDKSVLPRAANFLGDSLGATKKFVDFMVTFIPEPPALRPPEGARFLWNEKDLRKAFRVIYDYRSRALHSGRPFPPPMSLPPHKEQASEGFSEIMTTLWTGQEGGGWLKKDIPMNLHLFEYIARNVLLAWWEGRPSGRETP